MKTIKKLSNGFSIKMGRNEFIIFCASLENYVTENCKKVNEIDLWNCEEVLYSYTVVNLFKKLSENMRFPQETNKVKISIIEALVLWHLSSNREITWPGVNGTMMALNKQLLNSL